MLAFARLFGACGVLLLVDVFASSAARDFGILGMQREVGLAASLMIVGMQTFFGGFLLSIVAGNEADLEVVLEDAALECAEPDCGLVARGRASELHCAR